MHAEGIYRVQLDEGSQRRVRKQLAMVRECNRHMRLAGESASTEPGGRSAASIASRVSFVCRNSMRNNVSGSLGRETMTLTYPKASMFRFMGKQCCLAAFPLMEPMLWTRGWYSTTWDSGCRILRSLRSPRRSQLPQGRREVDGNEGLVVSHDVQFAKFRRERRL